MKNLVLASILGSVATAFAVPALSGPVHFAITRPYGLFGWLPAPAQGSSTSSVALGVPPLDFVMTDVMVGVFSTRILVTVNGQPVYCSGTNTDNSTAVQGNVHMTSGIFIPAGSTVGVEVTHYAVPGTTNPVTLAGYVQ